MMASTVWNDTDCSLLVTDDDDASRDSLCDFFDREGYRTFGASSGREAVKIAKRAFLHFVILDMHLPDFSGVETFRLITEEKRTFVPCIFMSADASKEQKLSALSAKAHAFVPKPINIHLIREVVDQILEKYYSIDHE